MDKEGIEFEVAKLLSFDGYSVEAKKNILYHIFVDGDGQISFKGDVLKPARGESAYQVDVVVDLKIGGDFHSHRTIPLVVIEIKKYGATSHLTTHDILTYSSKALKHKQIFPYLRYGLLYIHPRDNLPHRFFIHNVGFDFAIEVHDLKKEIDRVSNIVREQLNVSESLRKIVGNKMKEAISSFSSVLTFGDV